MRKIIVTGPESSGKSTLCKALSKHLDLSFSKEYAREYLDELNRDYKLEDLLKIAKKHLNSEQNTQLLDTDLITIKIWSNYKYGNCNKWILDEIKKQKSENRFYILCKPDIPWQEDEQRENPNNREEIFGLYKKELENLSHDYYIVEGENRDTNTISKILSLKPFI